MPRRNHRPKRVSSQRQVEQQPEPIRPEPLDTDRLARVLVGRGLADPLILGLNTTTSPRWQRDPETGERR